MRALALICLAALWPLAAPAQDRPTVDASELAPGGSLRPAPRPGDPPVANPAGPQGLGAAATDPTSASPGGETPVPRTPPAQGLFGPPGETAATTVGGGGSALAVAVSLRPETRPDGLAERVRAIATRNTPGRVAQPGRNTGTLCGVVGLQGEQIDPVPGRINGCGIPQAVRLRVVHGIQLTTPATINCTTAQSLSAWVLQADEIIGNTGGGIANLRVVASYSCRTRNNRPGARLSEHSTGNAIDIAGIGLANGEELSVLDDWRSNRSQIMRNLHRAACGPFGTVLGPDADRAHQDHFHFDVAAYRSGPYCR
ncbi:extensin family protein [Gymnodinialimonas sp. 2305UL16-5]|uniref:extensin-like domain-containing protein n=1 Tax=Gymnodinialimonas mytili TaxID=3126503 RepID=UPI0030A0E52A